MKYIFLIIFILSVISSSGQKLYDDFETGQISAAWSGVNSQIQGYYQVIGDAAKDESYGLEVGLDGSEAGHGYSYLYVYYTGDDGEAEIWVRYWVKVVDATLITSYNDANHGWHSSTFNKDNADTDFGINMYASGGSTYWRPYFGGTAMGDPYEITLNQWYEIKYQVVLNGSSDTAKVWIDGELEWSLIGAYANDTHEFTETIIGYYPNGPYQAHECSIYFDNFGIYTGDPGDFMPPLDDEIIPWRRRAQYIGDINSVRPIRLISK